MADNCPLIANSEQANADGDSVGDVCDGDDDADGIEDGADNCPLIANSDQANADIDSAGDVCDDDDDADGIADGVDNCPLAANPQQSDTDVDGIGDVCDAFDRFSYHSGPRSSHFATCLMVDGTFDRPHGW